MATQKIIANIKFNSNIIHTTNTDSITTISTLPSNINTNSQTEITNFIQNTISKYFHCNFNHSDFIISHFNIVAKQQKQKAL